MFSRLSLLSKIFLSTSAAITILFGFTFWFIHRHTAQITARSLEDEVRASLEAYRSLWNARAEMLASASRLMSSMSDVRAAFGTRDRATIQDTAGELWRRVSDERAIFIVADPVGNVIASLGGALTPSMRQTLPIVREAAGRFPEQASGFMLRDGALYQVVITPVYVHAGQGPELLNVLLAGFQVDPLVASRLKAETGGSEFLFLVRGQIVATTLNARARNIVAERVAGRHGLRRVSDSVTEYAPLETPLLGIGGEQIGELWILRSFEAVRQGLADLRRNLVLIWLAAVFVGFLLTYALARRIVEPVKALDRAAAEVARNNYDHQVSVPSQDELGRLARTFNEMCASIRHSRQELIRQERISTIGRLSSSIVHDLRNPLAAIYGGAEILVDSDLPPAQVKRLAGNIYRASRKIQELLQDLLDVSRGRRMGLEMCRLRDVALAGFDPLQAGADVQKVSFELDVPETIELPLERARIERVFTNLVGNALDVMPAGGRVRISASVDDNAAAVCVEDNGPGILPEIRDRLFQPFVSAGKRNGLGLGLALSRQTVLDHGGDMWVVSEPGRGARFCFKLPLARTGAPAGRVEGTVAAE